MFYFHWNGDMMILLKWYGLVESANRSCQVGVSVHGSSIQVEVDKDWECAFHLFLIANKIQPTISRIPLEHQV